MVDVGLCGSNQVFQFNDAKENERFSPPSLLFDCSYFLSNSTYPQLVSDPRVMQC